MPQFVLLLHDAGNFDPNMSPDQMQAIIQRYVAWRGKVQQNGRAVSGHKLRDGEGRVLRGSGATKVTDGPYAEARTSSSAASKSAKSNQLLNTCHPATRSHSLSICSAGKRDRWSPH